ncbi:uncharacterized protein LOC127261308 [Andrographis paniculata]|uniref:uncharacterized protein LOC127261308 n=1 Tax=Andrographis paniculata TaxID=175694 RepID=UPI0021E89E37|nr:uncharacterized protein LOC127261308 [Andrographis paniculata]
MLLYKQKKNQAAKGKRFLINITVRGSAGPIRFVVSEDDLVVTVLDNALKQYAREGRLPVLGSDINSFMLYCPVSETEAISPWMTIGSVGFRNFGMCKKPQTEKDKVIGNGVDGGGDKSPLDKAVTDPRKGGSGNWKAWFNKSLNLKISSH